MGKSEIRLLLGGLGVLVSCTSLWLIDYLKPPFIEEIPIVLRFLMRFIFFYFSFFLVGWFIPDMLLRPRKLRRLAFYLLPVLMSAGAVIGTYRLWQNDWISFIAWVITYVLSFNKVKALFPRMFKDMLENVVPGGPPAGGTAIGRQVDKTRDWFFFNADETAQTLNSFEESGKTLSPAERRKFLSALEDRDFQRIQELLTLLKRS